MKEIIAIIRPQRWTATKRALFDMGITSFTVSRVYGRGRQKGLRYLGAGLEPAGMRYIPKRAVWLWLDDAEVPNAVACLMEANRTGQIGDGKIFVCPVEESLRLRTGETGALAVR